MPNPRRRFLGSLLAAPVLPAAFAGSQAPPPSPPPTDADRMAEALAAVVERRYGIGGDDLAEIRKGIAANLRNADRLRAARKLGNGDEPVTVFEARPRLPERGKR